MNSTNEKKSGFVGLNGHPGISPLTSKINIWFGPVQPLHFQIKHVMKTSLQNYPFHPALFRIAPLIENPSDHRVFESAPSVTEAAFANLGLETAKLKAAKNTNGSDVNAMGGGPSKGRAIRSVSPNNGVTRKGASRSATGFKKAEFHLIAPFAKSVKLAADFTKWEKFPLDLMKSEGGVWHTVVTLPPGHYSYRFIVDGQWCDDPRPARRRHGNSFATANAVVEVT